MLVKSRILDAAEALLARYGYRKMTMEDLASAAGLSKGAVYLHFASKEDVAIARIDRVIGELLLELTRIAGTNRPAPDRLRDMLYSRVLFRVERVQSYRQCMDDLAAAIRPKLVVARREHHRAEASIFATVIRDGIRRLELRACSAARAAEALVLATNALLPADLQSRELEPRAVRSRLSSLVDLLLHGLTLPKGAR